MPKDHLKRISAPKSWPMQRKLRTFVTRPNPGRSFTLATSLNQVMKLMIKKGKTTKEERYILNHSEVLVNGTRVYDHRRPVGLMDIVSFPETKENFMITLSRKGKLKAIEVDAKQADSRLLKIQNKTRKSGNETMSMRPTGLR